MDEKGALEAPLREVHGKLTPTLQINIFAKDAILVPINLGNAHWTFACINIRLKRVEYYDSLGGQRAIVYEVCVQLPYLVLFYLNVAETT